MNQSEIYSLALSVGLTKDAAKTAAAIAMAESGGNQNAHTRDSDDDSYGLWQINMLGGLGPDRRRKFALKTDADLLNPRTNASVMKSLSQSGRDWSAWTTYTSGKYRQWVNNPVTEVNVTDPITGAAANIANGASAVVDSLGNVISFPAQIIDSFARFGDAVTRGTAWVSNQKNWVRVAYVAGGGILIISATYAIIGPSIARGAGKVASVATPVGRAAKVVKKVVK